MNSRQENKDSERMPYEFLRNQTPGYDRPWCGDVDDGEKSVGFLHSKKERRVWYRRMQVWLHLLVGYMAKILGLVVDRV